MSQIVAVMFGVSSAVVYGTSIVVQHRTAQQHAGHTGEASAAGLLMLIRSPVWWLAILGDVGGFLLQIIALSLGSVVLIQPLVVLMLPVSLLVSYLLGGHRPRLGDYLGVLAVLGGLGVFLALIGVPSPGHLPPPGYLALALVVVGCFGVLLCLVVTGCNRVVRGAVYGAAAGMYFGTLAVMVDAVSERVSHAGVHGLFTTARGLVPFSGILILGAIGIALTQMSFQVGELKATLPANLATDPLTAVLLGVILLHEHIPLSFWHIVAYVLCLATVLAGAIRLADPEAGPLEPDMVDGMETAG